MTFKIKYFLIIAILQFVISNKSFAQFKLSGKVFSSGETKEALDAVEVFNKSTFDVATTNENGAYAIIVHKGDTIEFNRLGYFSYRYFVGDITGPSNKNIVLSIKKNIINGIIVDGRTQYQRDSLARDKRYDKALNYEQQTSIVSPITSLYQQFSRKYQDLRKFQRQFASMEQQKYIDTKYTYDMVSSITKLQGDSAAIFMNTYPMEYDFARTSDSLEIKLWIKHNFKDYLALPKK